MDIHAKYYTELSDEQELALLHSNEAFKNGVLVLGGGSNILFTDDIPKWVLHNKIKGIRRVKEDDTYIWLNVGAGEIWHDFVMYCVQHNYAGVENLSLIPGTVGASPMQNIGAYGVEVKDIMESVRFFDLEQNTFQTYTNEQCAFGYRDSIFKNTLKGKVIITEVVFRLRKNPVFNISYGNIRQELDAMGIQELSIKAVSDAVIRIRSVKLPDPKKIGNAGSFFKNPEVPAAFYEKLKEEYATIPGYKLEGNKVKIPAGWLIEQCGWKGFREDNFGVHKDQALVLVNYGGANGSDIAILSERIMASVEKQFGIILEREVQIM